MARRRKRTRVSPLSAELTSVMRGMFRRARNCHPEIWARWTDIVGPEISRRAFPKSFRGTILVVGVSNSSWLQELSFLRTGLIDKLADAVGPGVVTEIRLVLDHGRGRGMSTLPSTPPPAPALDPAALSPELMRATEKIADEELKDRIRRAAAFNLGKRERERRG